MFRELKDYILENEFKITIFENKLNIVNYTEMDHFDDNKVIIRLNDKITVIKGDNLIISKLLDDELLISGRIKSVEIQ